MKYEEDDFLTEVLEYIVKTYGEHYATEDGLQLMDLWIADDTAIPTCRNLAVKYLQRFGKKEGNNRKDLLKAVHYISMLAYITDKQTKGNENGTIKKD